MSRYIDADKIPYVISEDGCLDDFAYRYDINEVPTADVVEVVRCKDCKYYTAHYHGSYGDYGRCDHPQQEYDIECFDMWVETTPDDYCSYGERREK